MNDEIRININSNTTREIQDLVRTIESLTDSLSVLHSELSNSSSVWSILDSGLNTSIGLFAILIAQDFSLRNIPVNIKEISAAVSVMSSKKGLVGLFGGALKALPFIGVAAGLVWLTSTIFNFRNGMEEGSEEVLAFTDRLNQLKDRADHLNERLANNGSHVAELNRLYQEGAIDANDLTIALEANERQLERLRDEREENYVQMLRMNVAVRTHGLSYDMLNDKQKAFVDRGVSYWQTYYGKSTEIFRKIGTENTISLDTVIANQNANRKATEKWQDDLVLLYARYGAEVAEKLRAKGESGMGIVRQMAEDVANSYGTLEENTKEELRAMEDNSYSAATTIANNLTDGVDIASRGMTLRLGEGADEVVALIEELGRHAPDTLQNGLIAADFPGMGEMIPAGLRRGIRNGEQWAVDAIEEAAKKLGLTVEEVLAINSPSRVFMGYGENVMEGLELGIKALSDRPVDVLERLASLMSRVHLKSKPTYQSIGRDLMAGLNLGLLNGEEQVMNTANRIANNITRTMRQAMQINSPSRVMREEIGRFIPEGVAAGIDKYADAATDSVYKLADDLVKVNFPTLNDVINMGPSLTLSGVGSSSSVTTDNSYVVNNQGLFDGAVINWHGEEDIRRTMEKINFAMERDRARLW